MSTEEGETSFPSDTGPGVTDDEPTTPAPKSKTVDRNEELRVAADKLKSNEWEAIPNAKGTKSEVWSTFYILRELRQKKILNFAECQKCATVRFYLIGQSTTSLKRHFDKCSKNTTPQSRVVTLHMKSEFKDVLIDLCVGDIRPFSLVEGDNFCQVVQKVIDLGAKHGPFEAKDLGVQAKSDAAREKIIPQILKAKQDSGFAFTDSLPLLPNLFCQKMFMPNTDFTNEIFPSENLPKEKFPKYRIFPFFYLPMIFFCQF